MCSVQYDIRSLMIPGVAFRGFSVSWNDVDLSYTKSDMMTRFTAGCHFKDEMNSLMQTWEGRPDVERIASVVELIRNQIEWDEVYKVMPDVISKVIKSRSGSNVDINCQIASCLRYAGYVVDPVLVKMRSSGVLIDFQPERNAFDTFILRVVGNDGKAYFIDGGSKCGYVNVLADEFLVSNVQVELLNSNDTLLGDLQVDLLLLGLVGVLLLFLCLLCVVAVEGVDFLDVLQG